MSTGGLMSTSSIIIPHTPHPHTPTHTQIPPNPPSTLEIGIVRIRVQGNGNQPAGRLSYVYFQFIRHQAAGIYYLTWPAKKLLPKTLTQVYLPIQPKTEQPAQPISQSSLKMNLKNTSLNAQVCHCYSNKTNSSALEIIISPFCFSLKLCILYY